MPLADLVENEFVQDVQARGADLEILLQEDDLGRQADELVLGPEDPVGPDHVLQLPDLRVREIRVGGRGGAAVLSRGFVGGGDRLRPGRLRHGAVLDGRSVDPGRPMELGPVFRLDLDLALGELGQVDLDLEGLLGQIGRQFGQVLVDLLGLSVGQDLVLQEFVRSEILDVGQFALPHGGDDVVVAPRPLGHGLDKVEELHELLAVEAAVEIEDLGPVLEKEEGQALERSFVGIDDLAGAGEREFLDPGLEPLVGLEELIELGHEGVDEVPDRGVVGREDLHGRNGVGQGGQDVLGLLEDLLVGEEKIVVLALRP